MKGALLLALICVALQHIPGSYTIKDLQDDYERTSPEGTALLALSDASLSAELFFRDPTLHRISRNAEIRVPADTHLTVHASTFPYAENDEVILKPATLYITSDRPLTFIYRRVTVANARLLRIRPDDPEARVQAVGHYRILSALFTAHRYHRQKKSKRDYKLPTEATVDFSAHFYPDHEIQGGESLSVFTGNDPGSILLRDAYWSGQVWQKGRLNLTMPFSDLEPAVNQLLKDHLPSKVDLGGFVDLSIQRIHTLTFSENFLDLHVEGKMGYANSTRVTHIFHPGFNSHLGIEFTLPEQIPLRDARIGVSLKNIFSLDFNRSNPVFDKIARDMARKYRENAKIFLNLEQKLPEIVRFPGNLFVEKMEILGDAGGNPVFKLSLRIASKPQIPHTQL